VVVAMSWRDRLAARACFASGAVCIVTLLIACLSPARAMAFGGEFADPSPNAPPAASVYNTAPANCATETNPYCEIDAPSSSLPPADGSNPETYLNSAYWPAEERPDIEVYAIQQYGYNYQDCSNPSTWNHYCFLVDAEAVGYPVTHSPQVGDLFLARCEDFILANGKTATSCPLGNIYYIGYVEQVLPDGSFSVTEGGTGPGDSGLAFEWLSGSMDANSDFIGFFPPGQSPRLPPVQVDVYYAGAYDANNVGGAGTVMDSNGQTCHVAVAHDCLLTEPQGPPVTFTATPDPGSTFQGFSYCSTGSGTTCTFTFGRGGGAVGAGFNLENPTIPITGGGKSPIPTTKGSGKATGPSRVRIINVTSAPGTIRASLAGSHLVCQLSRWTGHRWGKPRVQRCGSTVTYRRLTAGRYRLTVVSGKTSRTKVVVLRHGARRLADKG
jgi:hypothetical protein